MVEMAGKVVSQRARFACSTDVKAKETVLWTAEIRDRLVAEWQTYSDVEEAKKEAQKKEQ